MSKCVFKKWHFFKDFVVMIWDLDILRFVLKKINQFCCCESEKMKTWHGSLFTCQGSVITCRAGSVPAWMVASIGAVGLGPPESWAGMGARVAYSPPAPQLALVHLRPDIPPHCCQVAPLNCGHPNIWLVFLGSRQLQIEGEKRTIFFDVPKFQERNKAFLTIINWTNVFLTHTILRKFR